MSNELDRRGCCASSSCTQILRRVLAEVTSTRPRRRAGDLVATQIAGLAMMRYIMKLEPLASAPADGRRRGGADRAALPHPASCPSRGRQLEPDRPGP